MNLQKERLKNLGMAILIIILFFVWPYFSNSLIGLLNLSETSTLYLKFFSNFVFMFLLIALYYDDLRNDLLKYKKNFKSYFKTALFSLLVGLGIMIVCKVILHAIWPNFTIVNDSVIKEGFNKNVFLYVLMTILYYPITEELVFKKNLKKIFSSKWQFILITSFINVFFTIALTAENSLSYLGIIPLLALNSSFSYAYYKTHNITVSISMRILYNLIPTLGFLLGL